MIHVYHILTLFFIAYELVWLGNAKKQVEKSKRFAELDKEEKGWKKHSDEYVSIMKTKGLVSILILFWMVLGLLTFNWVLFLMFIIFQFVIIMPLSKLAKFNFYYLVIHWINTLIGLAFGIFVLINQYHLKIDLYKFLIQFFNQ